MERVLQSYFNPATITPPDTHEIYLREEITITAVEVLLPVKTLKAGKLQAAMKSDLKCSKP